LLLDEFSRFAASQIVRLNAIYFGDYPFPGTNQERKSLTLKLSPGWMDAKGHGVWIQPKARILMFLPCFRVEGIYILLHGNLFSLTTFLSYVGRPYGRGEQNGIDQIAEVIGKR
jgi:hypothetical protein